MSKLLSILSSVTLIAAVLVIGALSFAFGQEMEKKGEQQSKTSSNTKAQLRKEPDPSDDGQTDPNPDKPTGIIIQVREIQSNSISLRLQDQLRIIGSGFYRPHDGVRLFRVGPDGFQVLLAQFGRISDFVDFRDTELRPDAGFIYVADAFASRPTGGEVFTRTSTASCPTVKVFTRPTESRPIWRVQVELRTANRNGAATSDRANVSVVLNAAPHCALFPFSQSGTRVGTWLDYGRNDFERGDVFRYDINFEGVEDLSDIHYLTIAQSDENNGWMVAGLSLLVNEVEVYRRDFSEPVLLKASPVTQARLDVTHEDLRAHPLWQSYQQPPPPRLISRQFLQSKLESIVGQELLGATKEVDAGLCKLRVIFRWRDGIPRDGSGVSLTSLDNQRIRVGLKLEADVELHGAPWVCSGISLDHFIDIKSGLSFDIRVGSECTDDGDFRITFDGENPRPQIVQTLLGIHSEFKICTGLCRAGCLPFVEVTQDAELSIGVRNTGCDLSRLGCEDRPVRPVVRLQ